MKYSALLLAVVAIWFGFTALNIFVSKSNHMGSLVRNAERWGQWERKLAETSLSPENQKYWIDELRKVKSEGERGYDLLWEATCKLAISSVFLGFVSLYIYDKSRIRN